MKRGNQFYRLLFISVAVFGLALLYFFVDARYSRFFPKCPFFTLTGFYCPGCGSQRAASALLHGDILKAVHYNIMFAASLPLIFYSASVSVLNLFRTVPITQKIFYSPLFVKLFFIIVVLFWIFRNIPVYPFTILAP